MTSNTTAWYRQLWPWIIISLLSSAVIGSCASAYLALQSADVVLEHSDSSE